MGNIDYTQTVPAASMIIMGLTVVMLIFVPIYLFRKLSAELRNEFKAVMMGILGYVLGVMILPMAATLPFNFIEGMPEFVAAHPNTWGLICALIYAVTVTFSMWIMIRFLLAKNHTGADMFAFTIGFMGTEAIALAGMTILSNLMLAWGINSSGLEVILQDVPAEQVQSTVEGLQTTLLNASPMVFVRSFYELFLAAMIRLGEGMILFLAFSGKAPAKWLGLGFGIELVLRISSLVEIEHTALYYVCYELFLLALAAVSLYFGFRLYKQLMPEDLERVKGKMPKWAKRFVKK